MTGITSVHTPTAANVQATPSKKLFLCGCIDGKYKNPEPAE